MKVSINAIKQLGYNNIFDLPINELTTKIEAQLGALEESPEELGSRYDDIFVVKILACEKHPNADKLFVCIIDDNQAVQGVERDINGHVQVVCGAPNVRVGLIAAWLPPGSVVPSTYGKDPLKIAARNIRDVVSNGMLASASELAVSDDHSGLLEINPEEVGADNSQPGTPFKRLYGLDDHIITIENKMFTHRPDCFGFLGVAREIAGIQKRAFQSPSWYLNKVDLPEGEGLPLLVKNDLPELVPRFVVITLKDLKVVSSPIWLQSILTRLGVKPINNVVDATNYIMLVTGQPLHAYDYDKVKALGSNSEVTLNVRYPQPGEKLQLLNGKTIEPSAEAIMIASANRLIGIGGVMGGSDTEVDTNTKNIILECATFDMYSIRRTSMTNGLFTEAVTRFTKGQSPLQNLVVLNKAVQDLQKLTGGQPASRVIDDNHVKPNEQEHLSVHDPLTLDTHFISDRLGLTLNIDVVRQLLENVEFKVTVQNENLVISAPFWRTDIEIKEDIVEEIGRLYGFDTLPLELPKRDLSAPARNSLLDVKTKIREILAAAGANELLTYNFVHGDLLDKVGQSKAEAFQLSNALSPNLQYFRVSILPSLLEKVHPNIKAGYGELALFEINQTHAKSLTEVDTGLPIEEYRLGFIFAADNKIANLQYAGAPYFQAKKYLDILLRDLGIKEVIFEISTDHEPQLPVGKAALAPFERHRAVYVKTLNGKLLGELGELNGSVRRNLKLPGFIAGFELDVLALMHSRTKSVDYKPLPRFPKTEQDICLRVNSELSYQELVSYLQAELGGIKPPHTVFSLSPVDIYQSETIKTHKNITMRLSIADFEKTMTDSEVTALLDELAVSAHNKFGAERI